MTEQKTHLGNVACIVNPVAAHKKWIRRRSVHRFLKENLPGLKYDILAEKEHTIELARKLSSRSETIVAIGGDGTIADVLQGIRESRRGKEVVFGIVPLGSGNAFRRSLAIPKNIKKAIRILYEGKAKEIGLMDLEGKIAGFGSIGVTALVSAEQLKHKIHGFWGHFLAGRILIGLPRWEVEVELEDGLDDEGRTFDHKVLGLEMLDCVVAKSNYFGYGWRVAPQASLEDAYLDITFYETGWLEYILALPLLFLGIYRRTQRHFKAKRLTLRGKNLPIQYHGELLGIKDRVEAKVLPGAIKAICPPQA